MVSAMEHMTISGNTDFRNESKADKGGMKTNDRTSHHISAAHVDSGLRLFDAVVGYARHFILPGHSHDEQWKYYWQTDANPRPEEKW